MINRKTLILIATFFSFAAILVWLLFPAASGSFSQLTIFRNYFFIELTFGSSGIKFNIFNLISLLFLVATLVLNILNYLNIDIFKKGKIDITFTALLSLVSAGGILSVIQFTKFTNNLTNDSTLSLGIGAILSAIFAIISAGILFATKIFK